LPKIRKILVYPDKHLRNKSVRVFKLTKKVFSLCEDMLVTLLSTSGVGLSAPQLGENIRIILIRDKFDKDPYLMINPEILHRDGNRLEVEGCLSLPNSIIVKKRSQEVKVEFYDLEGNLCNLTFFGLGASIVQHEIDHLDGILIID
jgi:peptide deformylase